MTTFSRDPSSPTRSTSSTARRRRDRAMVEQCARTRDRGGRLFFCGSGGGAGHASHAACDFRKLARIESYCRDRQRRPSSPPGSTTTAGTRRTPTGCGHRALGDRDCLFVFSVGGGTLDRHISVEPRAGHGARPGGRCEHRRASRAATAASSRARADACVLIPTVDDAVRHPADRRAPGTGLAPRWCRIPRSAPATAKWESVIDVPAATTHVIITRTPLRITLGGGGTDLPRYYRRSAGGFLVAAAITKYVFIAVNHNFDGDILLKYSQVERVADPSDVAAPAPARDPPRHRSVDARRRDLVDGRHPRRHRPRLVGRVHGRCAAGAARAPARASRRTASSPSWRATSRSTGSASRSASRTSTSPRSAASPPSSSSQRRHGRAVVGCASSTAARHRLEDNLLLFYTGVRRSASDVLAVEQRRRSRRRATSSDNLDAVKALGRETSRRSKRGDLDAFGALLTEQWAAEVRALAHADARAGRRVDPRRHRGRRARRQARRRRRRRLPALLRRGQGRRCAPRWRRSGSTEVRFGIDYRARPSIVAE